MRQNSEKMKKVLPLLLFVLMAFAGCQRGPAEYKLSGKPYEVADNAEKFAEQTAKRSPDYTAEDWQVAVEQFTIMSKDFVEKRKFMSQEDIDRFDRARVDFMKSIDANGTEDLAAQIKAIYSEVLDQQ